MSTSHINRISEQRANSWEQAKAVLDFAAGENRDLSAAEAEEFGRINADLDKLDERRQTLISAIEREQAIDESRNRIGLGGLLGREDVKSDDRSDDAELRSVLLGEKRQMTFEKRAVDKAAAPGTVPTSVYGSIINNLVQANPIRDVATVVSTQSGENLQVPSTSANSTASLVAESAQATASSPTFVTRTLGSYKYLVLVQMSRELATDQGVDVVGFLGRQAGFALGAATRAAFTTGTGSSQPTGLMTSTTLGATGGTGVSGAFTADKLIELAYSVSAPYRAVPGCGFMLNSASLGAARSLKAINATGTVGSLEYMFQVGLQGQADSILGYPIYVNESMASTAVSAKSVAFGDFSRYFIREVNGISVETSTDFAFDYDLITTKVILRTDGLLIDQTGAVKHFVGGAS